MQNDPTSALVAHPSLYQDSFRCLVINPLVYKLGVMQQGSRGWTAGKPRCGRRSMSKQTMEESAVFPVKQQSPGFREDAPTPGHLSPWKRRAGSAHQSGN